MFDSSQRKQPSSTPQAKGEPRVKCQRTLSLPLLRLLIGETASLFLAGIVVPGLLRSGMAANHRLTEGSLHTLTIFGVMFSYTFWNLGFAVLGGLFGAGLALAMDSPGTVAHSAGVVRAFAASALEMHAPRGAPCGKLRPQTKTSLVGSSTSALGRERWRIRSGSYSDLAP